MSGLLLMGLLACTRLVQTHDNSTASPHTTVVLTERSLPQGNLDWLKEEFQDYNLKIMVVNDSWQQGSQDLFHVMSSQKFVVGFFEPEACAPVHFVSTLYNTSLVTWNCPQMSKDLLNVDGTRTLSPTISAISKAFTALVSEMKWKSVAIISSRKGWWPGLAQSIDLGLREIGITPRHSFIIGRNVSARKIENKLRILKRHSCTAIALCLPADETGKMVLQSIDALRIAQDHRTVTVLIDSANVPSWQQVLRLIHPNDSSPDNATSFFPNPIGPSTLNYLLVFSDETNFNKTAENVIVDHLQSTLLICDPKLNASASSNDTIGRPVCYDYESSDDQNFYVADVAEGDTLRLLVKLRREANSSNFDLTKIPGNLEEWLVKHRRAEECEGCEFEIAKVVSVLLILGCSCLFLVVLMGVATFARTQLLRKKVTKGPYKVILTATDFVFPQITDARRVEEGIEAMLCCWLQQLQEFGIPNIDKPDLLQSSSASGRTPLRAGGSSPNLAKQIIVDPRVRYNGDLVQMKPVPHAGGEIKDKAIELLVLLHGLRHENLNPLIGCLAEPPRAALVSEYCARGSLQDVLQQDDIKLDWSFRLSLLTDLVRGMKYLHSTPIRVHGYLTSRNCVIDARWVLKIADYGLPAFYEAQGITPPAKTAKELLWTAPELLRHSSLRKRGTQSGDVYSFGIILQEVVVRGEPFCMLALTPEEIIEKVKKPPPLIRPSVSKGAAPPEAINIMRQCWAEQAEMRPDFNAVHDQFKKLNHGRKVNIVDTMFQMLEKYSNNLEELIRERTEQLDIEKKKTEQLLNRMLPSSVADKLKIGLPVDPEEFEEVTIYFSDIVGFTTISAHSTPFQVVDLLNDLYTCFDATINAYNVYKVETIGDAYMVVGGLPVRILDHAEQIATMALDLLHQSGKFRIRHLPHTPLKLRIGLHTGPCCSGVVGLTMPRYCLFGDTVNTASRMESTGAAWRIHLSEATKNKLEKAGGYHLEYRGPTEVKGKGTMQTYWLLGKDGFDKKLPDPPPVEESHGLDESLIINQEEMLKNPSFEQPENSSPSLATSKESLKPSLQEEQHQVKKVDTNPSFIRSMELSKFSSLVSGKALEEIGGPISEIYASKQNLSMIKSTSSDTAMSLGTPVSASEVAAALLGASTSSLSCGYRRRRRIEDEDLSTPYNHYKCLSPKHRSGKLLRRQFSLDRTEESRHEDFLRVMSPKLCKQNSAGAADLEKIEEIPLKPTSLATPTTSISTLQGSFSISVDSLLH
ncbi:retinal guanylyl cyclase 2-like [Coccinella septempunctata]|uniref:retinal guanylyl cyclase 2-like n=1 Tax=Coccinella septempunctata TaxID=41139 RepID=UPI001D077D10|nr:retinal guanylyl cyclase 2-like [Coccinella septempunctata]